MRKKLAKNGERNSRVGFNETPFTETGACDLMEEHFRKSLGADYSKLFKEKPEKVVEKEAVTTAEEKVGVVKAVGVG